MPGSLTPSRKYTNRRRLSVGKQNQERRRSLHENIDPDTIQHLQRVRSQRRVSIHPVSSIIPETTIEQDLRQSESIR